MCHLTKAIVNYVRMILSFIGWGGRTERMKRIQGRYKEQERRNEILLAHT